MGRMIDPFKINKYRGWKIRTTKKQKSRANEKIKQWRKWTKFTVWKYINTYVHLVFRGPLNGLLGGRRNCRTAATCSLPLLLGRHLYSWIIRDGRGSILFYPDRTSRRNSSNGLIGSEKTLVDLGPTKLIHKGLWIVVSRESRTLERGTENWEFL